MSLVWKFLALYGLLEGINIDYQPNYEHARRHNKINKRAKIGIYSDLKGKECCRLCYMISRQLHSFECN